MTTTIESMALAELRMKLYGAAQFLKGDALAELRTLVSEVSDVLAATAPPASDVDPDAPPLLHPTPMFAVPEFDYTRSFLEDWVQDVANTYAALGHRLREVQASAATFDVCAMRKVPLVLMPTLLSIATAFGPVTIRKRGA